MGAHKRVATSWGWELTCSWTFDFEIVHFGAKVNNAPYIVIGFRGRLGITEEILT